MASSLSANCGSLLTLKLSTRCGFRPFARQMRDTEALEIPMAFRSEIESDNGFQFVGKLRIVADLETFDPMRLQAVRPPDARHRSLGDSHGFQIGDRVRQWLPVCRQTADRC